jgi:hypothetical protein
MERLQDVERLMAVVETPRRSLQALAWVGILRRSARNTESAKRVRPGFAGNCITLTTASSPPLVPHIPSSSDTIHHAGVAELEALPALREHPPSGKVDGNLESDEDEVEERHGAVCVEESEKVEEERRKEEKGELGR